MTSQPKEAESSSTEFVKIRDNYFQQITRECTLPDNTRDALNRWSVRYYLPDDKVRHILTWYKVEDCKKPTTALRRALNSGRLPDDAQKIEVTGLTPHAETIPVITAELK